MDELSIHMKSECVNAIQAQGTKVDFVAGGYTGVLQILDKGVKKPFKQHIWDAALTWAIANHDIAKPTRVDMLRWIEQNME